MLTHPAGNLVSVAYGGYPVRHCARTYRESLSDFGASHADAMNKRVASVAPIVRLSFPIGPAAVRRGVVAIGVNPVEAMAWGRFAPHVHKKNLIAGPLWADLDSAPAVIHPASLGRIGASLQHSMPRDVFSAERRRLRARLSVLQVRGVANRARTVRFEQGAPATSRPALSAKESPLNYCGAATVASTEPQRVSERMGPDHRVGDEFSVSAARDVFEWHRQIIAQGHAIDSLMLQRAWPK